MLEDEGHKSCKNQAVVSYYCATYNTYK